MNKIKVGDKVKSKSHPKLGTMKVLYVEPDNEVHAKLVAGKDNIVTVVTPYGADDTDLDDLILVESE